MSKHPQKPSNTSHSASNQNSADQYKRHINGEITIRGQLETHLRPDPHEQQETRENNRDRRDKKRYIVEIVTLLFVIVGAGFTGGYLMLTRRLVKVSQNTFEASNRPYVGIDSISVLFVAPHANFSTPTAQTKMIRVFIILKNFGTVPADHYTQHIELFVDGVMQPSSEEKETTDVIFPQQPVQYQFVIGTRDYAAVVKGIKRVEAQLVVTYDGPSGQYKYCETRRLSKYTPDLSSVTMYPVSTACPN